MVISFIIIILLLFGILLGAKRGFTYQLIKMLGTFLILFLSVLFKNKLALFFLYHFNFINLNSSVSIIIYRALSFIILFLLFRIILKIILKLSHNFEKLLNKTIILGIPSKILGGILGFIEYYIYIFILLMILSIPIFKIDIKSSNVACFMLNTPVISSKNDITLFDDLNIELNKDYPDEDKITKILIKHKIISKKDANDFINNNYNN